MIIENAAVPKSDDTDLDLQMKILRAMAEVFSNHDDDTLFDGEWPRADLMSEAVGEPVSLIDMRLAFPDWERIRSAPITLQEWDADPAVVEPQPQAKGLWAATDLQQRVVAAEEEFSAAGVALIMATQKRHQASTELHNALLRWNTGTQKPLTPLEISRQFAATSQAERAALAAQGQPQRPDPSRSRFANPNARGAFPRQYQGRVVPPGSRF
jgi:hypothetical protein